MAAVTGTKAVLTEFSGDYKMLIITATLESASDEITLTQATHGIDTIAGIAGAVITSGQDAEMMNIQVSYSGLVVTVESVGQDGLDSTVWANGVSIALIGS